jgi:hypothetical protein
MQELLPGITNKVWRESVLGDLRVALNGECQLMPQPVSTDYDNEVIQVPFRWRPLNTDSLDETAIRWIKRRGTSQEVGEDICNYLVLIQKSST